MEWCRRAALDRAHQRDQCSPRASISLSAVEPWEMRCVTCARIVVNVDVANILLRSDKAVVQRLGSTHEAGDDQFRLSGAVEHS